MKNFNVNDGNNKKKWNAEAYFAQWGVDDIIVNNNTAGRF